MNTTTNAPWHLWVVGTMSLLWAAYGCYDYLMTQLRNRDYIEAVMGPMGISVDEALAYFETYPLIAHGGWALGVWGSLAGAILLLARSRFAATAFLVSLIGAVVSFFFQFATEMPSELAANPMVKIMPVVIVLIVIGQWYYSSRQKGAGVLR